MSRSRGERLYALVEEYAGLGDHRTGTPVDAATADWFADRLRDLGAAVQLQPWHFDRYDARWTVEADGEPVVALPLFYEGVGETATSTPATATVEVLAGSRIPGLDAVSEKARAAGAEAVVLATDAGTGRLCAVNRAIGPATGLPTLCVPGNLSERLGEADVRVDIAARIVAGHSANVLGTLGDGDPAATVLVTTPLSGWFRCAGERGSGIAVALDVARRLAERGPVMVAGTTGHELMGAGQAHLIGNLPRRPAGILHVGASAAAGEGTPLTLASTRWAGGWVGPDRRDRLAGIVEHLRARPIAPADGDEASRPESWLGEAQAWAPLGVPMVSIAGAFPLFHAPEDVPEAATTPDLLAHVADALADAAALLQP